MAHPRTGISISALQDLLGLNNYEVRAARAHAIKDGAAMFVESKYGARNVLDEESVQHMLRFRTRHDVTSVNAASMRNAWAGKLLSRKKPMKLQYKHYREECGRLGIRGVKWSKYLEVFTARAFGPTKSQSAECEWCLDYVTGALDAIKELVFEVLMPFDAEEKRELLLLMERTIRLYLTGGEYATRLNFDATCAMENMRHALSDPDNPEFAEDVEVPLNMDSPVSCAFLRLRDELRFVAWRAFELKLIDGDRIDHLVEELEDAFGMTGLLRGIGHLVRDKAQSNYRNDVLILVRKNFDAYFSNDDYCTKLEIQKHVMGKSDAYGGAKTSFHGSTCLIPIPPVDAEGTFPCKLNG